jgi:PilZ domain
MHNGGREKLFISDCAPTRSRASLGGACASAHAPPSQRQKVSRPKRMMEERRKHPRTEISQHGYISSGGSVMHCLVVNISPEGAAVEVDNPAFVPQRFRLVMANDPSAVYECRIAWIQENRVRLTFVEP